MAQVYPNPARDVAQVTAPAGVPVSFYDETGTLGLHGLPAGSCHLVGGDGPRATRTRLTIF